MAWGIAISCFSLFGMLVLAVVSVTMDDGTISTASAQTPAEPASEALDLKKAA